MKIVVMEPLGVEEAKLAALAEPLLDAGHEVKFYYDRAENAEALTARVQEADIIVLANQPLPGNVIEQCANLKMLSVAFTGVDHIDLGACRNKNIMVCNAAGYSTNAVAELVFGLAISVIRNIIPCDARCRNSGTKDGLIGFELYNKTFGVIGTGAIGSRVAMIAKAFGCNVLAYSRTKKAELEDAGIKYVSLDELLQNADFISLHVPLNEATRGMINKDAVAKMKSTAVVINTARGPVIDSAALAEALNTGKIAGAGIDVFDTEPPLPEDNVLCKAQNTVVTPHIAFASKEALVTRAEIVFDNIEKWLADKPQNVVK